MCLSLQSVVAGFMPGLSFHPSNLSFLPLHGILTHVVIDDASHKHSTFLYFYSKSSLQKKKKGPMRNLNINFTSAQSLALDITTYSYAHKLLANLLHLYFSCNIYLFQLSWWFPLWHCVKCSTHLHHIPSFFPCLDISYFTKEVSCNILLVRTHLVIFKVSLASPVCTHILFQNLF